MFYSLGVAVGSSSLIQLNWFIFLIILGGSKLGQQIIQASALCPILPQHLQTVFCLMWRSKITGGRVDVSMLVEEEYTK